MIRRIKVRRRISGKNMGIGKRGASVWISWVLITVFMVSLGAFIYKWSASYAADSAQDVEDRAFRAECEFVAIEITYACQRTNGIDITIVNKKDVKVDKVIFSFFNVFGNAESREQVRSIATGEERDFFIIKEGTISTIKATPSVLKKERWIVCSEKETEYSDIPYC
jgi:hypothetical protein